VSSVSPVIISGRMNREEERGRKDETDLEGKRKGKQDRARKQRDLERWRVGGRHERTVLPRESVSITGGRVGEGKD